MKYGSLFSGACDGLSLGFEWACEDFGVDCELLYQVEIDEWCRNNLARHWPSVERFTDVRGLSLRHVDVIVGGFPCQDLSVAGKGAGLDGARSGLWFEYLRIIQETLPRGVLIENVPGLLRRGLDVVVAGLNDAGYEVEATRLQAADVGAPHKRERVFIVAYRNGERQQGLASSNGCVSNMDEQSRRDIAGCLPDVAYPLGDVVRHESGGIGGEDREDPRVVGDNDSQGWRRPQSGMGGGPHGLPARVDRFPSSRDRAQEAWEPQRVIPPLKDRARRPRLKSLGNAVVPQCAYIAARRLLERIT